MSIHTESRHTEEQRCETEHSERIIDKANDIIDETFICGQCSSEVEKVWQPGNLVARKILKNEALAESFWILLPHFLTSKQFGETVKERILVFLENDHISYLFFDNIPKIQ